VGVHLNSLIVTLKDQNLPQTEEIAAIAETPSQFIRRIARDSRTTEKRFRDAPVLRSSMSV
jgi:hypothetical protein